MLLLSAANFKDEWEEPIFDRKDTGKDTFYGRNYYTCGNTTEEEKLDKVTCDFMNTSWNGLCVENKHFQAVSIPMKNTRMTLVLPRKGISFDKVSSTERIKEIIELCDPESPKWKQGLVKLSLPKLQFQSDLDLIPMLQEMGIKDAFQLENADFGRVWKEKEPETSVPDLYVSKARQAGAVKVDENGCSVASYTEIAITESMMIPDIQMTMKCNRPFIIIVSDEKGIPLFVGAVSRIE